MLKKLLIPALLTSSIMAKDVVEQSDYCSINWSKGIILCQGESAEGQKKFKAKRAAVVVAQRNLLELIKGVSIDSQTTVENGMLKSDVIKSSVNGMIKGAQVVSNEYNRKYKSSTATLKLHIGKDLRKALMSDKNFSSWNDKLSSFFASLVNPFVLNAKESYTADEKETLKKLAKDFKESGNSSGLEFVSKLIKQLDQNNFTGLLVDARDVGDFKEAVTIKLVDEKGNEVYPGKYASANQFIGKNGNSVGLDLDIEDAMANKRVFDVPLKVKGVSTYKARKSDIVLSKADIEKLNIITNYLQKAKVIVVVPE
jgi:hypothetical protein